MMLYNPFPLLDPALLESLIGSGRRWWVRQQYPRGWHPGLRASFLLRAYEAAERELAQQHLQAIATDPHAFLYDTDEEEHRARLYKAAAQPAGFAVYYAGRKGNNWTPPPYYENRIKSYIRSHHPSWKPQSRSESIRVGITEEFGQLFLKLEFGNDTDLIPLSKLES